MLYREDHQGKKEDREDSQGKYREREKMIKRGVKERKPDRINGQIRGKPVVRRGEGGKNKIGKKTI